MPSNHRALADSHAQTRSQIGHSEPGKALDAPRHSRMNAFDPRDQNSVRYRVSGAPGVLVHAPVLRSPYGPTRTPAQRARLSRTELSPCLRRVGSERDLSE
jgi:hypothetical protein